jgi:small redox-active disulfide protein 2
VKKIIVLGPGCPRCDNLAKITRQAADELGIAYDFEKLTDIKQFPKYGLMMTPGLVVDGELKFQGKVPSLDEIKTMLGSER